MIAFVGRLGIGCQIIPREDQTLGRCQWCYISVSIGRSSQEIFKAATAKRCPLQAGSRRGRDAAGSSGQKAGKHCWTAAECRIEPGNRSRISAKADSGDRGRTWIRLHPPSATRAPGRVTARLTGWPWWPWGGDVARHKRSCRRGPTWWSGADGCSGVWGTGYAASVWGLGGDTRGRIAQTGQVRYGMLVPPPDATFGPATLGGETPSGLPQRGAAGEPGAEETDFGAGFWRTARS